MPVIESVVTSSDSDVVKIKSRRLESAESGKGKKTVPKTSDSDQQDQVSENLEVPETSNNDEGTDKENVTNKENIVTGRTGQAHKHKSASPALLTHKSSSPPHLSDFSDGGETDTTLEGEEERFWKDFKSKASASKGKGKNLSGGTSTKQNTELQQHKEKSCASWFDPNKFETKQN